MRLPLPQINIWLLRYDTTARYVSLLNEDTCVMTHAEDIRRLQTGPQKQLNIITLAL